MLKRILVAASSAFAIAAAAHAHTQLASSMPADKAVVRAAPSQLMLHFSQPVRLTALTIQKRGGDKQDLERLPGSAGKDFAVPAPQLGDGEYVVSWRALAEDTHVMIGEFTFTVNGAAASDDHLRH